MKENPIACKILGSNDVIFNVPSLSVPETITLPFFNNKQ
jgi:hypothetical protein